jgi:hypothetical protein
MPPVLNRAADLCPSCKADFEAGLGEPLQDVAEIALEITFAVAQSRAARGRRRKDCEPLI